MTKEILDILDEEGIKATFFVTSGGEYVKRAYNSGHTIALHTSSHKYSYVYSSEENYFNDLNTVSDSVYNSIGIRCKFIRFPGGSSNTISRNYNKGIMSRLVNAVTNKDMYILIGMLILMMLVVMVITVIKYTIML